MRAAVLEKPAGTSTLDTERVRAVLLVRVASSGNGSSRSELADDLAPLVAHRLSLGQWRELLDQEIAALVSAGLAIATPSCVSATEAGVARAAAFLNLRGKLPRDWRELRDERLVAKALGLQREPVKRIKGLGTPEGLRAAILQRGYHLKIKGPATPSRLRSALAAVALERAFGNKITAGLAGKSGLPAKAGRLLAAQLARKPRDFGTDARLVAALAAEHVGAMQLGADALRVAVLRHYLEADCSGEPAAPAAPRAAPAARPRLVETAPPPPPVGRPDLAGFVQEVRRHAATQAQGWVGNRKAFISHVWRELRDKRPEWGLSQIEFHSMLTEAHRRGQLVLASADLKDGSARDFKESEVVFKNAVFHFVRVDV